MISSYLLADAVHNSSNSWMTDVDMAMSGMITFVFLVVLIGCLNGQNIPMHSGPPVIKPKGRTAILTCQVSSSTLKSNALHWYRAQPGGAFQRLIYFEAGSTTAKIDGDNKKKYAGSVRNDQVSLTVSSLTLQDAGTYYCALWTGDNTVLTVRGNHYKNLLSESKRFMWNSSEEETCEYFNCGVTFCCQYVIKNYFKTSKKCLRRTLNTIVY